MSYAYSMEVNQAESTPMTDPYRALCAELIEAVLSDGSHIDCMQIARRARALLAEPVIPVKQRIFPTPSQAAECGGPCYEGSYCPEACDCGLYQPPALAQPEAEGPSASDVTELFYRHMGEGSEVGFENAIAEALSRWGRPAAAPVPVSERLQQLEDLAADAVSGLRYIEQTHGRPYGVGWDRVYGKADRLQPAHALPTPEGG